MKKLFNYAIAFIFIMSICGLDSDKWYIPFTVCILSGTYLFIAYKVWEAKQIRGNK